MASGYGGKTFDPIKFDGNAPPAPDVTDGCYKFQCTNIEVSATEPKPNDPTSYPMLVMTWEVITNLEPKTSPRFKMADGSVGGEIIDRVTFFPEEKRGKGRMGKQRYRELCDLFGATYRIVPLEVTYPADFNEFIKVCLNQQITAWVKNEPDRRDPDRTWPRMYLTEPQSWADPATDEVEPESGDATPETEDVQLDPDADVDAEADMVGTDAGGIDPEPEEEAAPEPPPPAAKKTARPTAPAAAAPTNGAARRPAAPVAAPARQPAPAAATRPGARLAAAARPAAARPGAR